MELHAVRDAGSKQDATSLSLTEAGLSFVIESLTGASCFYLNF